MTTEAWEDRYQDVVWARFGTFPFWPSYIFDPKLVSKKEPEYDRAQKMIGSKYFVLFYADNTLGFISPKDIRPFDVETTSTFAKQKMNRKDALKLPLAIEEARKEILLTKDRRLQWYFDKYNVSMDGSKQEEDDQESQEESELHYQKSNKKRKRQDESDEEASQPEDDSDIDDQHAADDWSEGSEKIKATAKKKRGRPPKSASVDDADRSGDEATALAKKKRGRPKKVVSSSVVDEDVSQPKPSKLKKKMQATPRAAAVAAPASVFAEESKMDRLERLAGILELTTDPSTFDEKRALKTLDKIKEIDGLQVQELKDSGLAKIMMSIKAHSDNDLIRSSAISIINQWKQNSGTAAPPMKSNVEPIKKQPSSAGFVVDRVSRVQESSVGNVVGQLLQKDGSSILTASLALERKRSVQLLDEVIRNEALALSLEAAIAQQLQYDLKEPSQQYFEAITRCFTSLKMRGGEAADIRAMVEQVLPDSTLKAFLESVYIPYHPIASASK